MELISNIKIAKNTYEMKLVSNLQSVIPGQFVEISLPGFFLRRPISICDFEDGIITLIYKVVGKGTKDMAGYKKGMELDVLGPFGNGYNIEAIPDEVTLIGGGVGIPPLYLLARELKKQNKKINIILGFNTEDEIFFVEEFKKLKLDVKIATANGKAYEKGFVTDLFDYVEYVCSCGPLLMLKAISKKAANGQYSFEARMGCGFGACMGCSIETKNGMKRVCKEGPIFVQEEIIW